MSNLKLADGHRCKYGERLLGRQTGHFVSYIGSGDSKPPTWAFEDYDKDTVAIRLRLPTKEAKARMSVPTTQELRASGHAALPEIEKIEVECVETPKRLRAVVSDRVSALAESMRELGLQQPITLALEEDDTGQRIILVAGVHRLEAARKLGWNEIPAVFVEAAFDESDRRLWEIDENLARAELSDLERAEHHRIRKEILEERGKTQHHGGDRRSSGQIDHLKSYAEQAAQQFDTSERTVRRDVHRAENIAPDVKQEIAGTDIAESGVQLDTLATASPKEQREAVKQVNLGHAKDVREVLGRAKPDPWSAWSRSDVERRARGVQDKISRIVRPGGWDDELRIIEKHQAELGDEERHMLQYSLLDLSRHADQWAGLFGEPEDPATLRDDFLGGELAVLEDRPSHKRLLALRAEKRRRDGSNK